MRRLLPILGLLLAACTSSPPRDAAPAPERPAVAWAVALHGGAGTIPRSLDDAQRVAYETSLERALRLAVSMLEQGTSGLDVVERVIRDLEDDPLFNAGRGAVLNHDRRHELDASIMNGADLACGAVAGVTTVRHPITLARRVMENTRHVLLAGPGAEEFADEMDVERVPQEYFTTPRRVEQLEERLQSGEHGTVGVAVLDRAGNLAAGTSTGGLTDKRFGRVGDSPVIGAGTYADNRTCAVSATGIGEEFIRHGVAHAISALIEHRGIGVIQAAQLVLGEKLRPGDGGVVAVGRDGQIAMVFNTEGMYRGAADATGRFEVRIWE